MHLPTFDMYDSRYAMENIMLQVLLHCGVYYGLGGGGRSPKAYEPQTKSICSIRYYRYMIPPALFGH